MKSKKSALLILLVLACSACATLLGSLSLVAWDDRRGLEYVSPAQWPTESVLTRRAGESRILVFAHPRCGCTMATLNGLERMLSKLDRKSQPGVSVLFSRPAGDVSWTPGSTWTQARSLPGAEVMWDEGGLEAARFGAATSGVVLFYDTTGKLLFSGGVTGSRGHDGDNNGLHQLTLAVKTGAGGRRVPPVFGCSLAGISSSAETAR